MSITIRTAKEVLKLLKSKSSFSVKFAGEPKEIKLTKKISLVGRGRFGGTDIIFEGSDGKNYFVKDMQSTVKGIGPTSPSEGVNKIFSIAQIETNKEVFLSVKREPKKQELPVWITAEKSSKEIISQIKIVERSADWKLLLNNKEEIKEN